MQTSRSMQYSQRACLRHSAAHKLRTCRVQRASQLRRLRVCNAAGDVLLEVKDLEAKIAATGQQILKGVNITVRQAACSAWPRATELLH